MRSKELVNYDDVIEVLQRLLSVAEQCNKIFEGPIVLVGGTAMAAHHIRNLSYDIDLYVRDFSDEVVHQVEQEFKRHFGEGFKIDVTSVENIWGDILLRDIHQSEPDRVMRSGNRDVTIQKLRIEDLFLLKLDTGREKDRDDLGALYEKTTPEKLLERFNTIWKWHGNRDAILGYADSFLSVLHQFGPLNPLDIIARMQLPEYMLNLLREAWSEIDEATL